MNAKLLAALLCLTLLAGCAAPAALPLHLALSGWAEHSS